MNVHCISQQKAQLNARGGRQYCPQSYKYNHTVRIWEVDAVGGQNMVILSGIGLAAILAVRQLAYWLNCASVYTVNCELCTASAQRPVPTAGHALWSHGPLHSSQILNNISGVGFLTQVMQTNNPESSFNSNHTIG